MEVVENNEQKTETAEKTHGFQFSYKAFEQLPVFMPAIQKMYQCKNYPSFKSAHRIKRLGEAIQKELNTYQEFRKDLKQDDPDYAQKLEDLHNTKVHIKWDPLSEQEVECIQGLSPADIAGIEYVSDPSLFQ